MAFDLNRLYSNEEEKTHTLLIVGDYNDADYVTNVVDISEVEVEFIKYILSKLTAVRGRINWISYEETAEDNKTLTMEEIAAFGELYVPFVDNEEVHAIEKIKIAPIVSWENLICS